MAKGYYGAKSKTFRAAKPATMRALRSAYVGRKNKKRDYRKLWIARINAAARMNDISYSRLIDGLKNPASISTERCCPNWLSTILLHSHSCVKLLRRLSRLTGEIKTVKHKTSEIPGSYFFILRIL